MRKDDIMEVIRLAVIATIATICVVLFNGCRSVRYVPVETVKTDTLFVYKERTDSFFLSNAYIDSLIQRTLMVHDTIVRDSVRYIEKADGGTDVYKEHSEKIFIREIDSIYNNMYVRELKERYENTIDSLMSVKSEKEQVPYPVEKPLTSWQRFFLFMGKSFLALIAIMLSVLTAYYILKKKKTQ